MALPLSFKSQINMQNIFHLIKQKMAAGAADIFLANDLVNSYI